MFDYKEMLNRLTLNSDGSVDKQIFNKLLECHNLIPIFQNIAKNILKVKISQIYKTESSDGILFKIKFDNDDSAILAQNLLTERIYSFSECSYQVKVKRCENKLKLIFKGVEI